MKWIDPGCAVLQKGGTVDGLPVDDRDAACTCDKCDFALGYDVPIIYDDAFHMPRRHVKCFMAARVLITNNYGDPFKVFIVAKKNNVAGWSTPTRESSEADSNRVAGRSSRTFSRQDHRQRRCREDRSCNRLSAM